MDEMIRRFNIRYNITKIKLPDKNIVTLRKQRADLRYRRDVIEILNELEKEGMCICLYLVK